MHKLEMMGKATRYMDNSIQDSRHSRRDSRCTIPHPATLKALTHPRWEELIRAIHRQQEVTRAITVA